MKKNILIFLLLLVFSLPVDSNAKAKLELSKEFENLILLEKKDDNYIFINSDVESIEQPGSILIYNSELEKIGEDVFFDGEGDNFDGLLESPNFFKYMLLLHDIENSPVIVKENVFYSIDYKTEMISFNNAETDAKEEFKLEDIEKTKNVLGNIYDIYLEVKKYNVNVTNIKEYGDIYIVYYYDKTKSYVSIMDNKKNIIKTYDEFDALDDVYYAYGDYIYIMSKNKSPETAHR